MAEPQKNNGTLRINTKAFLELFRQALLLPDSYHVRGYWDRQDDFIDVLVESADIPYVEDGNERPLLIPIYRKADDGTISLERIRFEWTE